jgi:SOUL heme-binding protein
VLDKITKPLVRLAESAGSVAGIRTVEEPAHRSEQLTKKVEIRRYGPRIAAETVVEGDETSARNEGFRRLAGYIFGQNRGRARIDMTAPVGQQQAGDGDRIAMTAPVSSSSSQRGWVIRFYMPTACTLESLPVPNDDRVRLVPVPAKSVAVLRFSGTASPAAVAARTAELRQELQAYGFETVGPPATWLYDPPWTIPFRRRNEIAIAITESSKAAGVL